METTKVIHLGRYLPKKYFYQDEFSLNVLRLKENKLSAKLFFASLLKKRLKLVTSDFILCAVPPSKPHKENPMRSILERLAHHFPNFDNGIDLLYRKYSMPSLCKGGERDFYEILRSIGFAFIMQVYGKRIILFDDVVTTGISFKACIDILKSAGAKEVIPFAIAQTQYRYYYEKRPSFRTA